MRSLLPAGATIFGSPGISPYFICIFMRIASLLLSSSACCRASRFLCCMNCCSFFLLLSSCISRNLSALLSAAPFFSSPCCTLNRFSSSCIRRFSCRSCSRSLLSARALRMISVLIFCFLSSNSLALLASSSSFTRCSSSILSLSATWSIRKLDLSSFLLHFSSISFFCSSFALYFLSVSSSSCRFSSSLSSLYLFTIADDFLSSRATRSAFAVSRSSAVVSPFHLYRRIRSLEDPLLAVLGVSLPSREAATPSKLVSSAVDSDTLMAGGQGIN
mmetsp:Transcript_2490/g.5955  ORF Transcript_2490/g.5955 Transcript_2490/m.5955 type:complete len:274 (-) Transcript_2490:38-859(-)